MEIRMKLMTTAWCALATTAVMTACGGGDGGDGGAAPPAPPAPPSTATLALIDEENDDGSHSLFVVDTVRADSGSKRLLDQGGLTRYDGRIVGERAVFSRVITTAAGDDSEPIDTDLYSVKLDGSDLRQLTSGPGFDAINGIAGERVVFTRFVTSLDVMSVKLDGNELRPLAADPARAETVSMMAGDVVVVSSRSSTDFDNTDLHAVKADGSAPGVPIAESSFAEAAKDVIGERIVFETRLAGPNGLESDVHSLRLAGDRLADLAATPGDNERYAGRLGDRVFIKARTVSGSGVAVDFITSVNADGTDKIPAFVPGATFAGVTAERLVFNRSLNGVNQLFSVAADGQGGEVQMTSNSRPSFFAGTAGEAVIVVRSQPLANTSLFDLHAVRLTDTGVQEVPLATSNDEELFQGSANGRVLFARLASNPGGGQRTEIYSIAIDGSGLRRLLADSTESEFVEAQRDNGRVIVRRTLPAASGSSGLKELVAVGIDGSNPMVLSAARRNVAVVDD
jgi:hypothetical protein